MMRVDLQDILDRVAEIMTRQFDARGAVIGLVDRKHATFTVSAHYTGMPDERGALFRRVWPLAQIDPGFRQQIVEKKHPVVIENALKDPRCGFMLDVLSARNIQSFMQIPLLIRGEVIGVILVSSEQPDREFTLEEAQFAETIAGQVSGAIENARLFHEAQQAQEQSEMSNTAKSAFLANMSHELRTPLNGILGYAQILKRDMDLSERQQRGLDVIEKSGNHLQALINDILDLAKIESGKIELYPEAFNLAVLLQHVREMVRIRAERKALFFQLEHDEQLPTDLLGDEKRLRQVLLNLLGNAIKFTDRGDVILRVTRRQGAGFGESEIAHNVAPTADLIFEVEDTGVGIAPDQVKAIFEPFQQVGDLMRRAEGTGLGLAISRKLIELMGGELSVESTPGQGSTFRFAISMPEVVRENDNAPRKRQKIVGIQGDAPRILVVDDNHESRHILIELLRSVGFDELLEAGDGYEALELVREYQPRAVITDIMMPGMDGLEFICQARQLPGGREIVILATSARAYEEDRQRCLAAGGHDFLPKPIQAAQLFELLQRHLKLEWVYAADERIAEHVGEGGIPETLPAQEILETLLDIVILGDIQAFRTQLDELERTEPELHVFIAILRPLEQRYHILRMREFLESCRQLHGPDIQATDADIQLSSLPSELLDKFELAATCSNITLMGKLIEGLRPEYSTLADLLAELAYQFDYEKILEIIHKEEAYKPS